MKKLFSLIGSLIITSPSLLCQTQFWGTTSNGGQFNAGTIFTTDSNGENHTIKYDFFKNTGWNPNGSFLKANNGKLYGITSKGGVNDYGILFEYDPSTKLYIKKIDFYNSIIGRHSVAPLIQTSDGKIYGVTSKSNIGFGGGAIIYEYNPATNEITKKYSLNINNEGNIPNGITLVNNGKIYGLTTYGGLNNSGVLFEYDPSSNIYTKKIDFDGTNNGEKPNDRLIQASNGKLYGTTSTGGINGVGVLFEYDPVINSLTKKVDFNVTLIGKKPIGKLVQASNGMLYGLTSGGGINNDGVLFEYDISNGSISKKIDFEYYNNGSRPISLMKAINGKLYGLTIDGGNYGNGVLFEYDISNSSISKKIDYKNDSTGANPTGSLIEINNGKYYGMTGSGGSQNKGVLFEYDINTNTFYKKIDFGNALNGSSPQGKLILAKNKKFYGLTTKGGTKEKGVLYEFNPKTNTYSKKIDFGDISNGSSPKGSLFRANNDKLYGLTSSGGIYDNGVLFEYDPETNLLIKRVDFKYDSIGGYPFGSLMQAENDVLYGVTSIGGIYNNGVLFDYNIITNSFSKKIDFGNGISNSVSRLTQANDGNLYGLAMGNFSVGGSAFFKYNINSNTLLKIITFNGIDTGSEPVGSLLLADNGKLYGLTSSGGVNDDGVLFEYTPSTNTFIKRKDFIGYTGGSYPIGQLMQSKNGKLYGIASNAVANFNGLLFEYDYNLNTITTKLEFTGLNGANSEKTDLTEVSNEQLGIAIQEYSTSNLIIYPNPVKDYLYIKHTEKVKIDIINVIGENVISSDTDKINMKSIISGIYFAKIYNSQNELISVYKIVKK